MNIVLTRKEPIFSWLPDSSIIRSVSSKIIRALEDVVQMELVRVRWEEINKLQVPYIMAQPNWRR